MDPMTIMTAIGLGMQGAQMGFGMANSGGQQTPFPQPQIPPPMQSGGNSSRPMRLPTSLFTFMNSQQTRNDMNNPMLQQYYRRLGGIL